jgi:hypothetical protein
LAAELTVKFELDRQPVRRALRKLDHDRRPPDQRMVLMEAYLVIDESGAAGHLGVRYWTEYSLSLDTCLWRPPRSVYCDLRLEDCGWRSSLRYCVNISLVFRTGLSESGTLLRAHR